MVLPFGYLVGFSPSLVAHSAGFFNDRGLDLTIETAAGSAQAIQQVLGGQALISRTGGPDHITAVAEENAPLTSVGQVSQRSPFELISHGENPVQSPQAFNEKTIGVVSAGGATEHLLNIMITQADIGEGNTMMEVVGNDPAAFELIPDEIDAFIATSGTRHRLESAGADIEYVSTDEFAPLPGQVYVTDSRFLDDNAEALDAFIGGVHEALVFMLEVDEDWEQTIGYLQNWDIADVEDEETIRAQLEVESQEWYAEDGTILLHSQEAWSEAQSSMIDGGAITEPAELETLYTNELVDRALGGTE